MHQLTTNPICYEAKYNQPAKFTVPKSGRIKHFKLVHVSGFISCRLVVSHYDSRWGCGYYENDEIMTAITDAKNNIITFHDELKSRGYIKLPKENAKSKELNLPLVSDRPYDVRNGQELRVWYTEDLTNGGDHDNGGRHCVHVFAKYC